MEIDRYITKLAIEAFNSQGLAPTTFDPDDFEVKMLPKRHAYKVVFEVSTKRTDDYFRLILVCNLGVENRVSTYQLMVDSARGDGVDANVWVADCTLSNEFLVLDRNIIRRGFYSEVLEESPVDVLAYENFVGIALESGDLIGVD